MELFVPVAMAQPSWTTPTPVNHARIVGFLTAHNALTVLSAWSAIQTFFVIFQRQTTFASLVLSSQTVSHAQTALDALSVPSTTSQPQQHLMGSA